MLPVINSPPAINTIIKPIGNKDAPIRDPAPEPKSLGFAEKIWHNQMLVLRNQNPRIKYLK